MTWNDSSTSASGGPGGSAGGGGLLPRTGPFGSSRSFEDNLFKDTLLLL